MKKIVAASGNTNIPEILKSDAFKTALEGLDGEVYGYDYTINVTDGKLNMHSVGEDSNMLPTTEVTPSIYDGKLILDVKLAFPELDSSKFKYYDDIQHYLKKWAKVGVMVTRLMKWSFNPDTEYED